MIRVFIGYDSRETVAWHVLVHSIIQRTRDPISISPIGNEVLSAYTWARPRGEHDSTEFSNARFLVPRLCRYQGWAIFMDCDMLCNVALEALWSQRDSSKAVLVKKHEQIHLGSTKFLGQEQARYARKNWSSLMLINCEHQYWKDLEPELDDGLDMHQFAGLEDEDIGELNGSWNQLLDPGDVTQEQGYLDHFTLGGPWHGWTRYYAAESWCSALNDMLAGSNPCATIKVTMDGRAVYLGGAYHAQEIDKEAQEDAEQRIRAD